MCTSKLRFRPTWASLAAAAALTATSLMAAVAVIPPAIATTGAFSAYSQLVLSAHPTAFYALNETAGSTASDSSGNGNDAAYAGTLNYGNPGVFADGSSSSIGVNGDAGWVAGPSVPPMAGGADRTIELWFKGTGSGTLFHAGQPGHTQSFDLTILGGGPGGCNSPSGPGAYLRFWDDDLFFPASDLSDGSWHYLAVTVSSSGAQVAVDIDGTEPAGYVWNGSCYTTSTVAQPFTMPFPLDTAAAGFGLAEDDQTGLGGWVGNMALAAIYPSALTKATLNSHFVAGTGSTQQVTNTVGYVVYGSPFVSYTWGLGTFDAQHAVTFNEGLSCFSAPGCPLDNWSATVDWGDGSPPSTASVLCVVPPLPGPAPTPPPPVTVHCSVSATHTYPLQRAYPITISLNNAPVLVSGEAEIAVSPSTGAKKASVGEMVAVTSAGTTFIPCTATAVLSANQATVVTAAHCVGDVLNGGAVYPTLKFAPGHSGPTCADLEQCGTNPYGVFHATAANVRIVTDVGHNQRLDWAFIKFSPLGGQTVGQAVPGLAVVFNQATTSTWTAIGYPYGKRIGPIDLGQYQLFYKTCTETSAAYLSSPAGVGPNQLIMSSCAGSGLSEGSSGGPWLLPDGAVGAVNKAYGDAGLLGTYLGTEAQSTFVAVSTS